MEPVKEGCFTKLGVLIAAIGVAMTWYYAHSRAEVTEAQRSAAMPPPQVERPVPSGSPSVPPAEPTKPEPRETRSPADPPRPVLPLDFTLRDGEQRTFLGEQASVAAEFSQIGSEDVVTLRVGTTEDESVPHAVLGAGARFPLRVAGSDYSVYVLNVDKTARTVGVRISRNSESQEKRGQ